MQGLEFKIDCNDQATKVVEAVQHKVMKFGKDVGHGIMQVVGPIAILHKGFEVIGDMMEEMKRKREEAFNWGASLTDNAAKLGLTAEEFQKINNAANKSGMSVEKLGQAFTLAADLIAKAKNGSLDAVESLNALGISVDDLDSTRPEDVLAKMSGALAAAIDPAEKMRLSITALGNAAKDLQDVLNSGFDFKTAFGGEAGDLTNEAAAYLRMMEKKKRDEELRAMAKSARQQATESFLNEDPEGRAIRDRLISERMRAGAQGAATGTGIITATQLSNQENIQQEVQRILKERADKAKAEEAARKQSEAANQQNQDAADKLRKKAASDDARAKAEEEAKKKKAEKDDKPKAPTHKETREVAEKASAVTVSSLRAIGGGLAGETATFADVAFQSLGEMKAMNDTLRRIEVRLVPDPRRTDFTKDPRNVGGDQQWTPGQFNPGPMTGSSRVGVA